MSLPCFKEFWYPPSMEDPMPGGEEARVRAKARQAEILDEATWKIGGLTGPLKKKLLQFVMKNGGSWEDCEVPDELQAFVAN